MPLPSVTGCRFDTLLGDWIIVQSLLESYVNSGWTIVEKGELAAFQAKSAAINDQAEEKPYTISNGIARLGISGPMTKLDTSFSSLFGGTSTFRVRKSLLELRSLFDKGEIKGVFIELDTPGGTVDGTAELVAAIKKTAAVMPVHMHASDMACSAGLWVGTQGTRFTCGSTASVGSLGVKYSLVDSSGIASSSGRKPVVIATGEYKVIGTEGLPVTEVHKAEILRIAHGINDVFKADVASSRKLSPSQIKEVATARVFIGQDAVRVGLCDAVCTCDEAYNMMLTPAPVGRDPGTKEKPPVAPKRSAVMAFTPEELNRVRLLPGASAVTETNAESTVLTVAETAVRDAAQLRTKTNEQADLIGTLRANTPKIPDQEILRERLSVATERLQIRVEKGVITSAQQALVMNFLTDGKNQDGSPVVNASAFEKGADGKYAYEKVFAVLDESPNGLMKEVSKDQPAPRTEPGKPAASDAPAVTMESVNKYRATAQQEPLTRAEFDGIYPEYAGK